MFGYFLHRHRHRTTVTSRCLLKSQHDPVSAHPLADLHLAVHPHKVAGMVGFRPRLIRLPPLPLRRIWFHCSCRSLRRCCATTHASPQRVNVLSPPAMMKASSAWLFSTPFNCRRYAVRQPNVKQQCGMSFGKHLHTPDMNASPMNCLGFLSCFSNPSLCNRL